MLKFYFNTAPNPMKVALFLKEAGLEYEAIPVDTAKGQQHEAWFRAVNPNGKVPAIDDDGTLVFDSNAILLYLSEKTGKFGGAPDDRGDLLSWLFFIASGLGPFSGQSVHFQHAAPEKPAYALQRYTFEANRHYEVMDKHLEGKEFFVGSTYTIADMAAWGWVDRAHLVLGEGGIDRHPNVKRWFDGINARPAVAAARSIGDGVDFKKERDEAALRALFPQNYAA